ncbi:MAG TPA: hypothetical protein VKP69_34560, partial [Isosphaeraceae bacterium]|nr:hypothetical protein [Isosphaeraceae bacterium]
MAAADESQGLKIAVAACVSLTVLLAVTAYFLYSAYSQAFERLRDAEENLRKKGTVAREALTRCDELRRAIGARAEEFEAVKDEIKAEQRNIDAEIGGLVRSLNESSAQAAGATGPELQDAKDKLQQIADAYLAEPNKNYISSMG